MSKAGRPKADVKKEKVVSVRMMPEEYTRLKQYAQEADMTITQVIQEGISRIIDEAAGKGE